MTKVYVAPAYSVGKEMVYAVIDYDDGRRLMTLNVRHTTDGYTVLVSRHAETFREAMEDMLRTYKLELVSGKK